MAKLKLYPVLNIELCFYTRLHKRVLMYRFGYIWERVNDGCVAVQPVLNLSWFTFLRHFTIQIAAHEH